MLFIKTCKKVGDILNSFAFIFFIFVLFKCIYPYFIIINIISKDILIDITGTSVKLLAHRSYDYLPVKLTDATIHVMNKFSLNSFIDKEFKNE